MVASSPASLRANINKVTTGGKGWKGGGGERERKGPVVVLGTVHAVVAERRKKGAVSGGGRGESRALHRK